MPVCSASTNFLKTGNSNQSSWYKQTSLTVNTAGTTKTYSVIKLNAGNYLIGAIAINVKNNAGDHPNKFYPGETVKITITDSGGFLGTDIVAVALLDPDTGTLITAQSFSTVQAVQATVPWSKSFVIPATWSKNIAIGLGLYSGSQVKSVTSWNCLGIIDAMTFQNGDVSGQTATPVASVTASSTVTATIPPGQCIDSDNGKNYFTKGIASFASLSGGVQSVEDKCDSTGKVLTEYFCTPVSTNRNITKGENYTCPDKCNEGACVSSSSHSPELLSITTYKSTSGGATQTNVANPPIPPTPAKSITASPPVPSTPTSTSVTPPTPPSPSPNPTPTPTATVVRTAPPVIQISTTAVSTVSSPATEFIVSGIKSGASFALIIVIVVLIGGVIVFKIMTAKD